MTDYDVLSNEIFFLITEKVGGIASVNYLKVKNDVTYRNTIVPDRNQFHAAPNVLFSGSYIASLCQNNLLHTTAPGYKGWRKE